MFSVIIATCNRPDRLVLALESTASAIAASGEPHHIIVADNGSDRLAKNVVAQFAGCTSSPVKYVRSAPLSKAAALNAGIKVAETDWLAFTDDDCTPTESWLKEGDRYAASGGVRLFSGRLQAGPVAFTLPPWLPSGSSELLPWSPAFVDYAPRDADGILGEQERVPFGANIFVQKSVFDDFGGYDEKLWDACGSAALGSEDAEFAIRVRARGLSIGYCHGALVVHPVYPERVTLSYYLKHIYNFGVREPFFADAEETAPYGYLFKCGVRALLKGTTARLRGDRVGAMRALMNATRDWGEIVGWRRHARQRNTA